MTKVLQPRREVLFSYWFNRFQVFDGGVSHYQCRDWLRPEAQVLPKSRIAELAADDVSTVVFQHGFVKAWESTFPKPVASRPAGPDDLLFWQFPCRTEAAAFDLHEQLVEPGFASGEVHCYVGLPWATWIDKHRVDENQAEAHRQVRLVAVRLSGIRHVLRSMGLSLRVHTVCQHVYWRRMTVHWHTLGVTDLWLSHAPADSSMAPPGFSYHPWHLFAVNVADPARSIGIQVGKDPAAKRHLASFIGVHLPHYLSDTRLRLREMIGLAGFEVQVRQDKWHFEDVVYRHQVQHELPESSIGTDETVASYNHLLSESVFSLCPAGAGPNTLRLWESLAVGSVPVLLGPQPRLPEGGTLPPIDWDRIVLRVPDEELSELPTLLRNIPMADVRRRQQLGLAAFAMVQAQRCF